MNVAPAVLVISFIVGSTASLFATESPGPPDESTAPDSPGDRDDDGVSDSQDCDPDDAELWAVPAEAHNLRLNGKNPTVFSWQPSSPQGGSYVRYDLLRSGSASNFSLANCTVSEASSLTAQVTEPPPAPGGRYFYLLRSQSRCGGALGTRSSGAERSGFGCVKLLIPSSGSVVGGSNVVYYADQLEDSPAETPVIEYSTDGVNFSTTPSVGSPDFGPGGATTTQNLEVLSATSLTIRARVSHDETVHQVQLDHRPNVACSASGTGPSVNFDCSASTDSDGVLASFEWVYGDGSTDTTAGPTVHHDYGQTGTYDVDVTVCDELALCTTVPYRLDVPALGAPDLQARNGCGCEWMTVHAKSNEKSVLPDGRRKKQNGALDPAPLGLDPLFMTFNFEVEVKLTDGSDPKDCPEGQRAKRTATVEGEDPFHKMACTAGWLRAKCANNQDCDFKSCTGGSKDGQPCNTVDEVIACNAGGGTACPVTTAGVCTAYPFTEQAMGNDDYRFPMDEFYKRYAPKPKEPRWFDSPGRTLIPRAQMKKNYRYDAEFVAHVEGDGDADCRCHFRILLNWNAATKSYSGDSGLTTIEDGDFVRCTVLKD